MRPAAVCALLLAFAVIPACRSSVSFDVLVDLPGISPFAPGSFDSVVVTDFREDAPIEGFAAGRALRDYLAEEIDLAFRGPVSRAESAAAPVTNPRSLVLAGSVRLTTEVRKALRGKRSPVDGPFRGAARPLIEVRRWTLDAEVSILSGADGSTLWRRDFREDCDYEDLEKPADFAFSVLAARVRARLLPALLGTTTPETRALLIR
jgi:hypothetical protein